VATIVGNVLLAGFCCDRLCAPANMNCSFINREVPGISTGRLLVEVLELHFEIPVSLLSERIVV